MKQRTGYLEINHMFSPGIPEDMARLAGVDPELVKEGKRFEADTLTCCHCKGVVIKRPDRIRERGSCPKCGFQHLCDGCWGATRHPDYSHAPFEQKRDEAKDIEAKYHLLGADGTPLGSSS